ncbi:MFS transporter [Streptosporangium sp. NPDC051023]|uniref:MFS transporter n=1 Tax=Streptosporangium sp. NPDC051023 TaxID=3155410 RepID=UPI00344C78A1
MRLGLKPDSVVRNRSFALLWSGQSLSLLGTQITLVALPLTAVVVLDATPMQAGVLGFLERLPYLLFAPLVGVLVDRRERRPLLIGSDWVRALLLGSIPVSYGLGLLSMGQLFAVAFVVGTMTVVFDVSYQAFLPGLVGRQHLVEANGRLQISESLTQVAGPGLAGLLIGVLRPPIVVAVDAVSYLVSALSLLGVKRDKRPEPHASGPVPSVRASLREGLSMVVRHPILRWAMIAGAVGNFFFDVLTAVFFLFLIRDAGIGSGGVSLIISVGSAGALCGALCLGPVTRFFGVGRSLLVSTALPGVGVLALAAVHEGGIGLPAAAAANFVVLFAVPIYNVTIITLRQAVTPDHLLGRVVATVRMVSWGALALGSLAGGALGGWIGLRETVLVAGVGLFVPAVILWFSPVRRMRSVQELADEEPDASPQAARAE